jgi:hypothetical protein
MFSFKIVVYLRDKKNDYGLINSTFIDTISSLQ